MSGYAYYIENGKITTGKDFLMLCARSFEIACGMRDKPLDAPLQTHFECDDWYKKNLSEAADELKKWRNMDMDAVREYMKLDHDYDVKKAQENIAKWKAANERYRTIREQIAKWETPNVTCENLKNFALEQIDGSIYDDEWFEIEKRTMNDDFDYSDIGVTEYWLDAISHAVDEYNRAKERYEKAVKRAEKQTKDVKEFIDSLDTIKE